MKTLISAIPTCENVNEKINSVIIDPLPLRAEMGV